MEVLCICSASDVNGPIIFLAKGTLVYPRLKGTILVNQCRFP